MTSKSYAITQAVFNTLPQETKEQIKRTLKAYNEVNIEYSDGKYKTSVGVALCSSYAKDHRAIGVAYVEDFYSFDERQANFKEEFGYEHYISKASEERQRAEEVNKAFIR